MVRPNSTVLAPPSATTPWVTFPDLYTAACWHAGGASWLQVTYVGGAGDASPVSETLGPAWGYHLFDVNLALGDPVTDVRAEEHAFETGARGEAKHQPASHAER